MPVLRYAEGADIEDAIAAAPLSRTNFPGESAMNAYCVVVSAVDALGNESDLPDEDDDGTCVTRPVPPAVHRRQRHGNNCSHCEGSYEALLQDLVVAHALPDDVAPATTRANV